MLTSSTQHNQQCLKCENNRCMLHNISRNIVNSVNQRSTDVTTSKLGADDTVVILDKEEDTQNIASSFKSVDQHNVAKANTSAEKQESESDTLENVHSIEHTMVAPGITVNNGAEMQESENDTLENSCSIECTTVAPGIAVNTGAENKEKQNKDKDVDSVSTDNKVSDSSDTLHSCKLQKQLMPLAQQLSEEATDTIKLGGKRCLIKTTIDLEKCLMSARCELTDIGQHLMGCSKKISALHCANVKKKRQKATYLTPSQSPNLKMC